MQALKGRCGAETSTLGWWLLLVVSGCWGVAVFVTVALWMCAGWGYGTLRGGSRAPQSWAGGLVACSALLLRCPVYNRLSFPWAIRVTELHFTACLEPSAAMKVITPSSSCSVPYMSPACSHWRFPRVPDSFPYSPNSLPASREISGGGLLSLQGHPVMAMGKRVENMVGTQHPVECFGLQGGVTQGLLGCWL